MIADTSSFGLFQFSVEKAYTVTASIPMLPQYSIIFLKTAAPEAWPYVRGKPCLSAHLPFPSIIKAICLSFPSEFIPSLAGFLLKSRVIIVFPFFLQSGAVFMKTNSPAFRLAA